MYLKAISIFLIAGSLFLAGMLVSPVERCRTVVLEDLQKHAQFQQALSGYSGNVDFLTALTKGR